MSLLKQNTTKKRRVNKNMTKLNIGDDHNSEYKVRVIWDNVVYVKESAGYLPGEKSENLDRICISSMTSAAI